MWAYGENSARPPSLHRRSRSTWWKRAVNRVDTRSDCPYATPLSGGHFLCAVDHRRAKHDGLWHSPFTATARFNFGGNHMQRNAAFASAIAIVAAMTALQFQASPTFAQSSRFCENYAHDYARRRSGGGVVGRTAMGAGAGGIVGGIANGRRGAGRGAAIGAGAGLVMGASQRSNNFDFYYRQAFRRCMGR